MGKLTHTVKGPIASFRSADIASIESLKLHFLPKQEGSGDPSPTNIRPITGWTGVNGYGSGENVLPFDSTLGEGYTNTADGITAIYSNGVIHITGNHNKPTWTNIIDFYSIWSRDPIILPPGSYIVASDGLTVVCRYDGSETWVNKANPFTSATPIEVKGFYVGVMGEGEKDITVPMIMTVGSVRPKKYQPYYPLKSFPITFPVSDDNLFSYDEDKFSLEDCVTSGSIIRRQVYHTGLTNGVFTLTAQIQEGYARPSYNLFNIGIRENGVNTIINTFIGPTEYIRGNYINSDQELILVSTSDDLNTADRSIKHYDIEIKNDAFYGGYVDALRGEIVLTHAKTFVMWGEDGMDLGTVKRRSYTLPFTYKTGQELHDNGQGESKKMTLCDKAKWRWDYTADVEHYYIHGKNAYIYLDKSTPNDTKIELCAMLAEPFHISITSQQLQAFLDYNNFWSDTNDDTEVEYAFADRLSERKLIMDTPHIASVSGSVASFNTDLKAPIVDLKAHFTPVQEGSGDPSPSNVRPITGYTKCNLNHSHRNLIKPYHTQETTVRGLTITPTANGVRVQGTASVEYPIKLSSQEIRYLEKDKIYAFSLYINGDISGCKDPYLGYHDGITYRSIWNLTELNNYSYVWTVPERYSNAVNPWFDMYIQVKENSTVDFEIGLKMEEGSSVTAYEPYSGETIPIEFPATKNLFDNKFTGITGSLTYRPYYLGVSSQVTVSTDCPQTDEGAGTSPWSNIFVLPGIVSDGASIAVNDVHNGLVRTVTPIDGYITLAYRNWLGVDPRNYHTQIEIGSVATAYEPYGTVYGGYVDLIRGKVIAEWKKIILDGTEDWYDYGDSNEGYSFRLGGQVVNDRILGYQVSKCSMFNNIDGCWGFGYKNAIGIYSDHPTVKPLYFRSPDGIVTTLSGFKQWLSENKPELCYKLAVPIEYDITPQILKTLKGTNNIWADTNENVEVKYWTH